MPKWDQYPHALPCEDSNNGWSYPDGRSEKEVWEELRRKFSAQRYEEGFKNEPNYTKENDHKWAFDKKTGHWKMITPFENYDPVTRIVHYYSCRTWNVGDGYSIQKKLPPEKDGVAWALAQGEKEND